MLPADTERNLATKDAPRPVCSCRAQGQPRGTAALGGAAAPPAQTAPGQPSGDARHDPGAGRVAGRTLTLPPGVQAGVRAGASGTRPLTQRPGERRAGAWWTVLRTVQTPRAASPFPSHSSLEPATGPETLRGPVSVPLSCQGSPGHFAGYVHLPWQHCPAALRCLRLRCSSSLGPGRAQPAPSSAKTAEAHPGYQDTHTRTKYLIRFTGSCFLKLTFPKRQKQALRGQGSRR